MNHRSRRKPVLWQESTVQDNLKLWNGMWTLHSLIQNICQKNKQQQYWWWNIEGNTKIEQRKMITLVSDCQFIQLLGKIESTSTCTWMNESLQELHVQGLLMSSKSLNLGFLELRSKRRNSVTKTWSYLCILLMI